MVEQNWICLDVCLNCFYIFSMFTQGTETVQSEVICTGHTYMHITPLPFLRFFYFGFFVQDSMCLLLKGHFVPTRCRFNLYPTWGHFIQRPAIIRKIFVLFLFYSVYYMIKYMIPVNIGTPEDTQPLQLTSFELTECLILIRVCLFITATITTTKCSFKNRLYDDHRMLIFP